MPIGPIIGRSGKLDIPMASTAGLVRDFAVFLQFSELQKQLERTRKKLKGLVGSSPQIEARYEIPLAFDEIYRRRQLNQKIGVSDARTYHAISFMAGSLEAASQLNDAARSKFRSRILGALRPDRDFRAIEHEVRCFVHFRQAGYAVRFADYEGFGRYDFLASRGAEQFEIECKLISPDIGYAVKIERSIGIFEAILKPFSREMGTHLSAGIYQIALSKYDSSTLERVPAHFRRFVSQVSSEEHQQSDDGIKISFEARPRWQLLSEPNREAQLEFLAEQEKVSSNSLVTNITGVWCMIRIGPERAPRILRGIIAEVKSAAEQLSKSRPGLIWVHLAGWTESDFRLAAQHARERANSPFNIISNYILRNQTRDHISAIWYSANSSNLSVENLGRQTVTKGAGPAYMTQSHRGRFPLPDGLVARRA